MSLYHSACLFFCKLVSFSGPWGSIWLAFFCRFFNLLGGSCWYTVQPIRVYFSSKVLFYPRNFSLSDVRWKYFFFMYLILSSGASTKKSVHIRERRLRTRFWASVKTKKRSQLVFGGWKNYRGVSNSFVPFYSFVKVSTNRTSTH